MGIQINLKLSEKLFQLTKTIAEQKGFDNIQDFIRETLRNKIFDDKSDMLNGLSTMYASEASLSKNWLSDEEDKAWQHLQKEI